MGQTCPTFCTIVVLHFPKTDLPPPGNTGAKPGTLIASLFYASRRAKPSTLLSNGDDMASPKDVLKQIADNEVKFVDFRFTDTVGREHHVSVPTTAIDEDKLE